MFRAHEHVITWRAEKARLEPRPDARNGGTRYSLVSIPGAAPLSVDFVRHCIEAARQRGATEIITPAVTEAEAAGMRRAGFQERSALHLLVHDLDQIPSARRVSTAPSDHVSRRANRSRRAEVLAVDAAAFGPEWCLDAAGLEEAIEATPSVRFRLVEARQGVRGYAVTGRAGRRGYLQRLAVHPDAQRLGLGQSLVVDALRWCRRWHAARVVVNTQVSNTVAYDLYRRMGFVDAPVGLCVLHLPLNMPSTNAVATWPS